MPGAAEPPPPPPPAPEPTWWQRAATRLLSQRAEFSTIAYTSAAPRRARALAQHSCCALVPRAYVGPDADLPAHTKHVSGIAALTVSALVSGGVAVVRAKPPSSKRQLTAAEAAEEAAKFAAAKRRATLVRTLTGRRVAWLCTSPALGAHLAACRAADWSARAWRRVVGQRGGGRVRRGRLPSARHNVGASTPFAPLRRHDCGF